MDQKLAGNKKKKAGRAGASRPRRPLQHAPPGRERVEASPSDDTPPARSDCGPVNLKGRLTVAQHLTW